MKSYRDTAIPAASRAVNLVRWHHGVPGEAGELTPPASVENSSLRRNWVREARANHLSARRRKAKFEEIPVDQFPVILEISGGSNFVVLKERNPDGECLVQFPDSRESIVDASRIAEVYDGTCVFLNPKAAGSGKRGGGGLRKLLASLRPTTASAKSFFLA